MVRRAVFALGLTGLTIRGATTDAGGADTPWPTDPAAIAAERAAGKQLQAQLESALAQHAARLVVAPGIYRLSPESPDAPHLLFKKITNFELVADGVKLICETKNSAVLVERCDQVTFRGLTIDYDPLPMTQGTITAVAPTSLDFTVNAGYDPVDYDGRAWGISGWSMARRGR